MSNNIKRVLLVILLVAGLVPSAGGVQAERSEAPVAITPTRNVAKQLVAGGYFTCSLAAAGTVRCWGDNYYGQLGNGSTNSSGETSSVAVVGIANAVEITAGDYHACALLADGRVKCWGYGLYGQLGYGSKGDGSSKSTAVYVQNSAGTGDLTDVTSISAGQQYTCAILSDKTVKCWGQTQSGRLGNGDTGGGEADWKPLPVDVKTNASTLLTDVEEIATGGGTSCALLSGGTVKCWGGNGNGQLGIGNLVSSAYAVGFDTITDVIAVTAGMGHVCVLQSAAMHCAGGASNKYVYARQMNNSTPVRFQDTDTPISNAKQIIATDSATCILRSDSTVACAGGFFQWEDVSTTGVSGSGPGPTSSFTAIDGLTGVVGLTGGGEHICASLVSGMKCWGKNNKGQLGNGVTGGVSVLVDVVGLEPSTVAIADPGAKNVDSAAFDLVATSSSGSAVTLSVADESTSVCAVSMGRLTVLNSGSCVVNGAAAASGIYAGGTGTRTIVIAALAPTVGAATAGSISLTGASLSASVNAKGASTAVSVEYGTNETLEGKTTSTINEAKTGIAASSASVALTTLNPGTKYYFRFVATNAVGTTSGSIVSFTTSGAKPTATTGTATADAFGAALAGEVIANEVDATALFEYGTDSTLVKSESVSVVEAVTGSTAKAISAAISKLVPATTYYYRVVATNSVGTTRGEIKSFTTKGSKPTAATGSATRAAAGMTVNGKVNPKDLETTFRFEYGTDPKLAGAQQTAAKSQTGAEDVDVTAVLTGLSENTTYYYRVTATNIVGTTDGDIKSFTTTRPEGVSINDGDEFTSSESVTVSVVGPSTAVKAILSNDGGFKTTETFDLTNNSADIPWKLQSSREGTFTKIVYVKYVSRFGSQSQAVTDDIILDTTKPVMTTATATAAAPTGSAVTVSRIGAKAKPKASGGVRLSLRGSDTISGIGTIEVRSAANKPATKVNVSRVAGKADGKPRAASQTVTLRTTAKRLQVRVIDRAGNASAWRTITVR